MNAIVNQSYFFFGKILDWSNSRDLVGKNHLINTRHKVAKRFGYEG